MSSGNSIKPKPVLVRHLEQEMFLINKIYC